MAANDFGLTQAIQDNLTLDDKPKPSGGMRPPPPQRSNTGNAPFGSASGSSRRENIPPRRPPPPGHRPSRSQEEAMRARRVATGLNNRIAKPSGELDIFADPPQQKQRQRRNSESSVKDRPLDAEEEKKRQERRRRERRHREHSKDSRSKRADRKLDIIDKLDVTSIYGTGLFHHDGPFDACNPHRNRTGSKRAPMQAFPKDSLNNVLGGGGPLNKKPDHATFLGNNDEEAFRDYSNGGAQQSGYELYNGMRTKPTGSEANVESATTRVEPIHGEETLGLGSSTFLDGAPASKKAMMAMQQRENELASPSDGGGLGRKKSLAQKIRGINNSRREYGPRVTSPGVTSPSSAISPQTPAYTPGGTQIESSSYFNDEFTKGDDKKVGENITFVEPPRPGRARAPSIPKGTLGGPLERRVTSDGSSGPEQTAKPGSGFLARVKSLKGGPRKPKDKIVPQQQMD
ncbi:Pal1 cell morphology protein-domain-containing protein [Bisporella sp. PMI_857]|nr:Pal1 cell morphology protein-domain-containing protein [Bisporella sp. PMI_857]